MENDFTFNGFDPENKTERDPAPEQNHFAAPQDASETPKTDADAAAANQPQENRSAPPQPQPGAENVYGRPYPPQGFAPGYQPYNGYVSYDPARRVVNDIPYRSENPYSHYNQQPERQERKSGPKKRTGIRVLAIVLAAVVLVTAGIFGGMEFEKFLKNNAADPKQTTTAEAPSSQSGQQLQQIPADKDPVFVPSSGDQLDTFNASEIYKNNVNSIVGINNNGETYNIFGQITSTAISGTGFIISEDGYILTNYHVVNSENISNPTLTVTLYNGDQDKYDAKVVGYDSFNDVALVKIEASGLTPVSLGDSDEVEPGQNIAIIGHPLGQLTYSISKGIVSSTDRRINVEGVMMDLYQIDAAVNGGNSGGPAFNENGQVIGIVNAKYASSTIEGLGFIIPINSAVKIANDIINYGFVRGQAGFGITVKTVYRSGGYYMQIPFGLRVESVTPGSCAEKAGIKVGDVIIRLGNTEVSSQSELNAAKATYKAGDTAEVTIYRDQSEITLTITFDEFIPEGFSQTVSPS